MLPTWMIEEIEKERRAREERARQRLQIESPLPARTEERPDPADPSREYRRAAAPAAARPA